MPVAFRIAPLSAEQHAAVVAAFNQTPDAETRLRDQMVLGRLDVLPDRGKRKFGIRPKNIHFLSRGAPVAVHRGNLW